MSEMTERALERLAARLEELERENAALRLRVASMEQEHARRPHPRTPSEAGRSVSRDPALGTAAPGERRTSRRGMLTALGLTAGAGAASLALRPGLAAAATGDPILAGQLTNAERETQLQFDGSGSTSQILTVADTVTDATVPQYTGSAIYGVAARGKIANGVYGYSKVANGTGVTGYGAGANIGVVGKSDGGGNGVLATSASGDAIHAVGGGGAKSGLFAEGGSGYGVAATSTGGADRAAIYGNGTNGTVGVQAQSDSGDAIHAVSGSGNGVSATSAGAGFAAVYGKGTNGAIGVQAQSDGGTGLFATSSTGRAVDASSTTGFALSANSGGGPSQAAIYASGSNGTPAVWGASDSGRGGLFTSGSAAQVQLVPGSAATHPDSGQAGDLFVDSGARLWFCKGGTTWVELAPATVLTVSAGWNLVAVSTSGLMASGLLTALITATGGALAALYQLSNGAWSQPLLYAGGHTTGTDFPLQLNQGYLLYSDRAATSLKLGGVKEIPRPAIAGAATGPDQIGGALPPPPTVPGATA